MAVKKHWISDAELARLRDNLREAQETLDAIRTGEVDAVVVSGARGSQIYSLSGAEQPYRVYVERMQEGAVTVSADGLILYCNQRFADMLHAPLERVISSRLVEHVGPDAWQRIAPVFAGAQGVVKQETLLHRSDGSTLPINIAVSKLPLENQNVACLVVTDLSEQKKHEELRLAKDLAEKASLAKDEFLAALSHELRTPLTPVLMTIMALEQESALSADARASLSMVRRNVELEARLIDDLLDLTRIASGKLELNVKEMDLHAIVQRAVEICQSDFTEKEQTLTLDLKAENCTGAGDPIRIQQAVWNLVRNASKFTGVKGRISIRTSNPEPHAILMEIEDTGIGFEPGTEGKLFQPFEQGGRRITRQFGGLGLGLAIARSIIEAHGGVIQGFSLGLNQGATFSLRIPLRPFKSDRPRKRMSGGSIGKKSQRRHILLVEDHRDTRNSLEFLLRRYEHEVLSAASASEALQLAEQHEFDIVISDIGLPDKSGLDLMEELRDKYGLQGIGLSGYGMEEDVAKGHEVGFVSYLTKPVTFDRLQEAIAQCGSRAEG